MRAVLGFIPRIGVGQDAHGFSNEGSLVIGGLTLCEFPKLRANSDGDIILHALFNAISSAIGNGSLGQTADKMCMDGIFDSKKYLNVTLDGMRKSGYSIGNVSISLVCEKPKIDPIVKDLKKSLSKILDVSAANIGITATTEEGFLANSNASCGGVACTCNVTLV